MTKEEKQQCQEKLFRLLSSPDEVNVRLALEIIKGMPKKGFRKNYLNATLKEYKKLYQIFFRGRGRKWKGTQVVSHITALNQSSLHLRNKQLRNLPGSVGKLQSLQELDLSHNRFTRFPESIGKLQNLQQLYLSHNRFTRFPENIEKLQYLQKLNLQNNQLTSLPESITGLQELRYLYIRGNPDLSITPTQKDWMKNLPKLRLDVKLDQIPVRTVQAQQAFNFDKLALGSKNSRSK